MFEEQKQIVIHKLKRDLVKFTLNTLTIMTFSYSKFYSNINLPGPHINIFKYHIDVIDQQQNTFAAFSVACCL